MLNLVTEELKILAKLLLCRQRHRIYRHHLFFKDSAKVLRMVSKATSRPQQQQQQSPTASDSDDVSIVLDAVLRMGESAVNEVRANRIDSLPLSLALLGVAARLHSLLSTVSGATCTVVLRKRLGAVMLGTAEVTRSPTTPGPKRGRSDDDLGVDAVRSVRHKAQNTTPSYPISEGSIGGVLTALMESSVAEASAKLGAAAHRRTKV